MMSACRVTKLMGEGDMIKGDTSAPKLNSACHRLDNAHLRAQQRLNVMTKYILLHDSLRSTLYLTNQHN